MTEYLTEQEQVEQLKNWLKEYGLTVLLGIGLAFLLVSGWHYWQNAREKTLYHASAMYDEMLTLRTQNNMVAANRQAQKLMSHYAKTPYAQMAAFTLARNAVLNKNMAAAHEHLNWVRHHSKEAPLREIARLREARLYIEEKKPDAALALLTTIDDQSFIGLIDEIKGDAYLAMHDPVSAKSSYQLAIKELPQAEAIRPVLQMKFDNLTPGNAV